ncbi:CshA/CshB family fibrillar adhesin-related protein, partial [Parapedobacter pyrenivorans]
MRNTYKSIVTFILSLIALVMTAQAQYATEGTSVYKDQVLWITWGGGQYGTANQPLPDGTTSSVTIQVADGQELVIDFTIETTSDQLRSYRPGAWSGDILDDLYHIDGPGSANQLINGISRANGTATFTIRAVATLNGDPFPIKGFVMADAEAINTGTEYIQGRAEGQWHVVEMAKNIGAGSYIARKTNNGDGTQTLRLGPGTDNGTAAVSFLAFDIPAPEVSADFTILGGGTTAIAIGVLAPNADFGDAPASYGDVMHLIPDLIFAPDNIGAGVDVDLNTNNYEPGGLVAPLSGFLGTRGPDAEGGSQYSDNAGADDNGGVFADDGDEEDAWSPVNIYVEHGGNTLTQQIPCSGTGTVAGWIDFNNNGTFDADERASGGCVAGFATLSWTIPIDIQRGLTFVRLRFASDASEVLLPDGIASDGEVEDHVFTIYEPGVSLRKEGAFETSGPQQAGDRVLYTFTLENTGNVGLENIVVEDDKVGAITWTVGGVTWNPSTDILDVGMTAIGTVNYVLMQTDVDAGRVENQATVGATPIIEGDWPVTPIEEQNSDDPGPSGPEDPTVLMIPALPSLSFIKEIDVSVLPNPVVAGEETTYTFTVTNTGNVTLTDVSITDDLQGISGLTYDWSSAEAEGILRPGQIAKATATYLITQSDIDAGKVENLATVTGTPPFDPADPSQPGSPITPVPSTPDVDNPGTPGDPGIPTVVDVPADPSLSFAKTGVVSVDGNTIEYTFTVTNTGNVTMEGITIDDPKITNPIVLDATTLAPGETATGTATYTVTQVEKDAGEVENNATVTGTPPFDPADPTQPGEPITPVPSTPDPDNPGTPGNPEVPTIVDVPADPLLSFAKTGVLSTDGNTIEYTFTVTNTGNVTMEGITLVEASFSGTGTAPAPVFVSNSGTSAEGTLAPDEVAVYTATYTLTQADKDAGEVENAAAVTGTPPTTDPGNPATPITPVPSTPDPGNPGTPGDPGIPTIVDVPGDPSLSFAKTGVLSADGNTIEYTFTVTNIGNVTMEDVAVTDPKITNPIILTVTTLAPGDIATGTATYTLTQAEKDAGNVENAATVTGTPPFDPADPSQPGEPITPVPSTPDPGNPGTPGDPGIPTIVDVPADPSLSFAKTGVLSADGNTIEYTFTVTNSGNVTMEGITIDDPKIMNPIVLTATTLAPGKSTTGTATYTISQTEKDAGEVENLATVTGTPPFDPADPSQPGEPIDPVPSTPDTDNPGTPGDPGVPTEVVIPVDPALSFVKTGELSSDGNTVTYTFTVTNVGNVTMTNITLAEADFSGTGTAPVPAFVSNSGTSEEGTLAPGEAAIYTATYTLTQADKDAGGVEN